MDLLRLLEAHAARDPEARIWLESEAATIRDSVLTRRCGGAPRPGSVHSCRRGSWWRRWTETGLKSMSSGFRLNATHCGPG